MCVRLVSGARASGEDDRGGGGVEAGTLKQRAITASPGIRQQIATYMAGGIVFNFDVVNAVFSTHRLV